MKAEHRHELKTNALAEWLGNLPELIKKNLRSIIYVSVIAVVVIGYSFWYNYNRTVASDQEGLEFTNTLGQLQVGKQQVLNAHAQGIDASFMLLQPAGNLQAIGENSKNDQMAAIAFIKHAQTLHSELLYRLGTVNEEDVRAQIEKAKESYSQALSKAGDNMSLIAAAQLGLALCEEELGQINKARESYRQISENPDFAHTTAAASAKARLGILADYEQAVVFTQVAKPAPTMQPEISIGKPENINIPAATPEVPENNVPVE